jgi:flagellar biosynthetic protein FliR
MRVKAIIALMLALTLAPTIWDSATGLPSSLATMAIGLAKELLLGLLLGSTAIIVVSAAQIGGQLASQLAGLDLASSADPTTEEEAAVLGQLFNWLAAALFLILGGYRQLVNICVESYATYPAGGVLLEENWLMHLPGVIQDGMSLGIRASAPLAVALVLANLVTAIIGRTLPQLNVLAIGFNINSMVMLVVLCLTLGSFGWVFQHDLSAWLDQTARLFPAARAHG